MWLEVLTLIMYMLICGRKFALFERHVWLEVLTLIMWTEVRLV